MLKIIKAEMRESEPEDKAVKGRVFFFLKDENILEDLQQRYNRPYEEEFRKLLPQVLEKVGFGPLAAYNCAAKAKWSQKAGCGCGCSPGFIIPNLREGQRIFVDVKVKG